MILKINIINHHNFVIFFNIWESNTIDFENSFTFGVSKLPQKMLVTSTLVTNTIKHLQL